MTIRRAARGLFVLAILLVTTIVAIPSGRAQSSEPVTLRLVSQTPWNTLKDPVLDIAVQADNAGASPIDDLTLGVTIGAAVRSRTAYETSLASGPQLPVFAVTTVPENHSLEPGGTRRFRTSVDLSAVGGISRSDSLIYPMRIDLRSGGSQVAVVDTAVIFLVRVPEVPLLASTTIELTAPIAFDPDGLLVDPGFEASVAPTGSLGAEVSALARLARGEQVSPVDLVVQPSLLDELSRMADGYERADGSRVPQGEGGAAHADTLLTELRHGGGIPVDPHHRDAVLRPDHPLVARERPHGGSRRSASGGTRDGAAGPGDRCLNPRRPTTGWGVGRRGRFRARRARGLDDPRKRRHGGTPSSAERVRSAADRGTCGRRADGRPGASRCQHAGVALPSRVP